MKPTKLSPQIVLELLKAAYNYSSLASCPCDQFITDFEWLMKKARGKLRCRVDLTTLDFTQKNEMRDFLELAGYATDKNEGFSIGDIVKIIDGSYSISTHKGHLSTAHSASPNFVAQFGNEYRIVGMIGSMIEGYKRLDMFFPSDHSVDDLINTPKAARLYNDVMLYNIRHGFIVFSNKRFIRHV